MPELPETETLARDLHASLVGRTIVRVSVLHGDVLRNVSSRALARRLSGRRVTRVWRRAKAVVLDLKSGSDPNLSKSGSDTDFRLVVVPRFTGGLLLRDAGAPDDRYDAVRFVLDDESVLAYRDVRRLGTVTLFNTPQFDAYDSRLGKEPLDPAFTPGELSALLRASGQPVKKLLMDQSRIAGVGNIYANEALWAARIDPSRPGRSLTPPDASRIHAALVDILRRAITARGTTFRDYRDASGNRGEFVRQLAAYGRGGEPCLRCGARLTMTHAVDGRATVFCHRCQA
ncbi:MAG TPA: bifunctional DNA-formamidopyrimidine glycosylase/DNA-(apurinic or apyrimidinic site) lyase [Gemmatimonadaceae bacterium]